MRLLQEVLLFVVFGFLTACSPSGSTGSSAAPADHQLKVGAGAPAQGQINGQEWVFHSGRAYFKKYQTNYLVVQLWNEDIADPCKEKRGSTLQVHLTAPKELRTWRVSPEDTFNSVFSIFFADLDFKLRPQDNMKADRGEITFTSIDKRFVGGYIAGSFQKPGVGGTRLAGDFVVPFCRKRSQ
jgi:hypothetical protein